MEVANGYESDASREDTKPLTLAQRINRMVEHCDSIQKEGAGIGQGHAIDTVLASIRPLLSKYKINITPNYISHVYDGNRCDAVYEFVWECVETKETMTVRWPGADTDKAGKALAKAGTNALKEHLKKVLKITDKEDKREETDQVEHVTAAGMSAANAEKATETARKTREQFARTLKAAYDSAPSTKAITALKRENSEGLASLEPVTRDFFDNLFSERIAALKEAEDAEIDASEEALR